MLHSSNMGIFTSVDQMLPPSLEGNQPTPDGGTNRQLIHELDNISRHQQLKLRIEKFLILFNKSPDEGI